MVSSRLPVWWPHFLYPGNSPIFSPRWVGVGSTLGSGHGDPSYLLQSDGCMIFFTPSAALAWRRVPAETGQPFAGQSSQAASHEMAERRASVGSAGSDFLILGTAGCKLLEVRPLTRLGNPIRSARQRWLASLLKPSSYRQECFTGNPNPHGRRLFLHLEQSVGGQNLHGGPAEREFHKVGGWPENFFRSVGYSRDETGCDA